jgi:RNA processing factor Prp31
MYYRKESNQYILGNQPFVIDGTQYPANWLAGASDADKEVMGVEEVKKVGFEANREYYWVAEQLNGAEITYINTPKDLDEVKSKAIKDVNRTAYGELSQTDWMVIRTIETQKALPEDVATYREAVRSNAAILTAAIELAEDVDKVAELIANQNWPAK